MSETQLQIILAEPGRFESALGEVPAAGPNEALVRIRHIGVCGTDIHAFHGRQPFFEYPRILGHELGGEVILAPDGSDLKTGDIVAVEPYLNDPDSPASRRGKTNCCESLRVLGVHCDGGMRPVIAVPVEKLHRSQTLSTEQLALVEMLCIGRHAVERARVDSGEFALVIGAGPIGMSVLQFLQTKTDRVAVADISESRLAFCREGLGVDLTLLSGGPDPVESTLRALSGSGELPTVIFDASGNAGSMMGTFDLAAHGGRIVFVGLFQGEVRFNDPNFHRRELTVMSSRNATANDFREVIRAIETGVVDTTPWITHRLGLGEVPARFAEVIASPTLRKAVIAVEE
ncbi:MAG: zinc-binding alcohol dehydrogenase family protein [Verrucomicrobiae bacterium]|nr:zinc-binding alcohol dehydrogenase family protein [Verrucomicrobiae bacterium]